MKVIKTITKVFDCGDTIVARLCKYSMSSLWILTVTTGVVGDDNEQVTIDPQSLQEAQELLATLQAEGDKLCK